MSISFEMLPLSEDPVTSCEIYVTYNGEPLANASVSMEGGRFTLYCLMMETEGLAKTAAAVGSFYGQTGADGKALFAEASLSPFIDYAYSINGRVSNGQYMNKTGIIRLNKYWNNRLHVELGQVDLESGKDLDVQGLLSIAPNPFRPSTRISFSNPNGSANINIYDVSGRLIKNYRNVKSNSVVWNAAGLSSGIYILRAQIGNKQYSRKLFLKK
jgi:hypothetical protein